MSAKKKEKTSLIVAFMGGSGQKSTSVSFTTTNGVRPWAWIENEIVTKQVAMLDTNGKQAVDKSGKPIFRNQIRAGVTLLVSEVRAMGNVETSYVEDGIEISLQKPKQQLLLGGNDMEIIQPQFQAMTKLAVAE